MWVKEEDKNQGRKKGEERVNNLHPYLLLVFSPHVGLLTILPYINKLISSVVLLDLDGRGLAHTCAWCIWVDRAAVSSGSAIMCKTR